MQAKPISGFLIAFVMMLAVAASLPKAALADNYAALVEHAEGIEGVEALGFLAPGDLIDLGSDGRLTLSYLSSCRHEKIHGGLVRIGATASDASGGEIDVTTIPCEAQTVTRDANGEATVVRKYAGTRDMLSPEPDVIVFSVFPVLKSLKRVPSVRLVRLDRKEPERELLLEDGVGDFRTFRIRLAPEGLYQIINAETDIDTIFRVDPKAETDSAILSRLVVI